MTVRIDTDPHFPSIGVCGWWENFLNQRENGWDSFADLDAELAKYNARFVRYIETDASNQVEFKSEEDMTLFLMRWA